MFVLLTSSLPFVFFISLPYAICIGISLGAIIIKDIKAQIIEKTRGSFVKIMLIGLIVSLACIYISGYIIPNSNISFNNAYRSALLNDDDIIFERIANNPKEMTMTQLIQEINLLKMNMQENNRLLNIYKYELQQNIAISLSSLFFSFFSFSLVFNNRKYSYIALVISIIVCPIYYFLFVYIRLKFIMTGYAHYIVWIPNMILLFVSFSVNFISYFKKSTQYFLSIPIINTIFSIPL